MVAMFTLSTIVAMIALQWTPYRVTAADMRRAELQPARLLHRCLRGVRHHRCRRIRADLLPVLVSGKRLRASHRAARRFAGVATRRGWLRVLHADATSVAADLHRRDIAFYILGAAILHSQGLQVTDSELIETLSQMYQQTLGGRARGFFSSAPSRFSIRRFSSRPHRTRACLPTPRAIRIDTVSDDAARLRDGSRGLRRSADHLRGGLLPVSSARRARPDRRVGQA